MRFKCSEDRLPVTISLSERLAKTIDGTREPRIPAVLLDLSTRARKGGQSQSPVQLHRPAGTLEVACARFTLWASGVPCGKSL